MMMAVRRLLAVVVLGGLVAAGVAAAAQKVFVHSSLDRLSVLPERVRWVARTDVPSARVRRVDFLIDGKVHWTERNAPYFYGDDGNWLVTSWLKPGSHRFTTRLTEIDGARLWDTVRARTKAPAAAPSGLSGRWTRTFAGSATTPAGKWTATIDATGWHVADPHGGGNYVDVVYPRAEILQARGGIWTRNPTGSESANNGAHVQEGNGWCGDTNATDTYHYTLNGNTLTLTLAGAEHCGTPGDGEAAVWAGAWIRVA